MTRLFVFATLIFCAAGAQAQAPDFSAYKDKIKGPPVMFGITTRCDNARLVAIENTLQPGQKKTVFYSYILKLTFAHHQVAKTEISGMHFSKAVRECIIKGFNEQVHPQGQLPESGRARVDIAFPAVITPRPGK